jgi:DNA polymerase
MKTTNPSNGNNTSLVYFVGLSSKPNCEPLSEKTKTGQIIKGIEILLPEANIIKINLVSTPPLDENGKLRYPSKNEMEVGWMEIKDQFTQCGNYLMVLLGQQVSGFLRAKVGVEPLKPKLPSDFSSELYLAQASSQLLSVHHPSFVYVYRRQQIQRYISSVAYSILYLLGNN